MTVTKKVQLPTDKREWHPSLVPGPIALISTVDADGVPNAAPKSWLQMVSFEPSILMFSGSRDGRTERNILATESFGVNLVDADIAPAVFACAKWHGAERIERSGFRLEPASVIRAPLVDNCKAHLECRLHDTKAVGSGFVVFGEIVAASAREELLVGDAPYRYARFEQALFQEEGLFSTVDWVHPTEPEPLSERTTRWVILLSHARPDRFSEDLVRAHVTHLKRLQTEGRLDLCGPFPDHDGGMVVLRATNEAEAKAIAESDPFVSSGAETYELRRLEVSSRDNNHLGMG